MKLRTKITDNGTYQIEGMSATEACLAKQVIEEHRSKIEAYEKAVELWKELSEIMTERNLQLFNHQTGEILNKDDFHYMIVIAE